MNVVATEIPGVLIVEPQVFGDSRGWFVEQYNAGRYKAAGIDADFVQDNESFSSKGVVRGAVWDVAVDIRKGSPTFGRHVAVTLSAENRRQFYIPRGCAHGFIVLEDDTLFRYKCDRLYCKEADRGMLFSDPALCIEWPDLGVELKLSEKDRRHPPLKDILPWFEE